MPDRRTCCIRLAVVAMLLSTGLLLPLLWLWVIRHEALLQWAIAISLCGVGSGLGIYGVRTTEKEVTRLRELGPPEASSMLGQHWVNREWREFTTSRRNSEWGLVLCWTLCGVLVLGPLMYLLSAERTGHELLFRAAASGYALSTIVVLVVGSRAMDILFKERKEQR